jgi:hypothetical protein
VSEFYGAVMFWIMLLVGVAWGQPYVDAWMAYFVRAIGV